MPVSEFVGDCHICVAVAVVYGVSTESSPNSIGTWGELFIGMSFLSDYCTPFLMT